MQTVTLGCMLPCHVSKFKNVNLPVTAMGSTHQPSATIFFGSLLSYIHEDRI